MTAISMLFQKGVVEILRDPPGAVLTVGTVPAFVLFFWVVQRGAEGYELSGFVPSLLVFAVIMLVFSTGMAVAREVQSRTLDRLRLTGMKPVQYLLAVFAVQTIPGSLSVLGTLGLAYLLGFSSQGSFLMLFSITMVSGFACIGIGLMVGSVSQTVSRAFLLGSVCMFFLLLFSGLLFPVPLVEIPVFGRTWNLFELLPTTHAVGAISQIIYTDAGSFGFEFVFLGVLAAAYFLIGAAVFSIRYRNVYSRCRQ